MKLSAGILLYQVADGEVRVLLVHPGGPFWAKKDLGAWSIPKGEYAEPDDPAGTAVRELREETGLVVPVEALAELGTVRQKGGKQVSAFAAETDFDVTTLVSNTFELEWPPRSGQVREFPEVDRAEWFPIAEAMRRINGAQAEFIQRLQTLLAR